jgi:hypothetical protein
MTPKIERTIPLKTIERAKLRYAIVVLHTENSSANRWSPWYIIRTLTEIPYEEVEIEECASNWNSTAKSD